MTEPLGERLRAYLESLAKAGDDEGAQLVHEALTGIAMDTLRFQILADEIVEAFEGKASSINNVEGFVNARGTITREWKFGDTTRSGEEPLGS